MIHVVFYGAKFLGDHAWVYSLKSKYNKSINWELNGK